MRALLTGKSIRNKLRGSRSNRSSREEDKLPSATIETAVTATSTTTTTSAATATASNATGKVTSPLPAERRFSRLFSLRRSVTASVLPSPTCNEHAAGSPTASVASLNTFPSVEPSSPKSLPLPHLLEEDEFMSGLGLSAAGLGPGTLFQRRHQPPALPPMPANLSPEQVKRRYIVATIIHSENSYVASLQRLVNVSSFFLSLSLFVDLPPRADFLSFRSSRLSIRPSRLSLMSFVRLGEIRW